MQTIPATRRPRLSRSAAFTAIAIVFIIFTAASAAPSPLYVVYQDEWGFSSITLTAVFAIYVVGMLGALLVVGALSDHIGRRPVLAAGIALEAVSLVLFLVAGDVTALATARLVQGVATGAAFTTLGAALVDLDPPHARGRAGLLSSVVPPSGLALGALGTGFLVEWAPAPTQLIFALLLGGMAVAAVVVATMPETSTLRPGWRRSLQPRVGVPAPLRADILSIVPVMIASWALGGLYMSLGPSVAAALFDLRSHVIGGLVVTLLCGTGAVTAFVLRAAPVTRSITIAGALLAAGMVVTLVGVEAGSAVVAAVGTLVAGVGFGAASLGSFGTLARIATPSQRGEIFAVAFVISYVAFALPAVIAGISTNTSFGLKSTTVVYGLAVVALGLATLAIQALRGSRSQTVATAA